MALLSERQQQAAALARELQQFDGVWVVNPMPLDNNSNGLRVQILEGVKNRVFQAIADWGFAVPQFVSMTPRITHNGMAIACVYEIPIEKERQPIPDSTIRGELADPRNKKSDVEIEGMRRYLGIGMKK